MTDYRAVEELLVSENVDEEMTAEIIRAVYNNYDDFCTGLRFKNIREPNTETLIHAGDIRRFLGRCWIYLGSVGYSETQLNSRWLHDAAVSFCFSKQDNFIE